jgi:hypothetical protein
MDRHTELCEKYAYLKSRKRLDLLKSRTGICYHNLIKKTEPISDNALNIITVAHSIALSLEISELETNKKLIEGRLSEIGGGL